MKIFTRYEFPALRNLTLTLNDHTPDDIMELVKIRAPMLDRLVLKRNYLGDEGFEILMNSTLVLQLKMLEVSAAKVTAKGLSKMAGLSLDKL